VRKKKVVYVIEKKTHFTGNMAGLPSLFREDAQVVISAGDDLPGG